MFLEIISELPALAQIEATVPTHDQGKGRVFSPSITLPPPIQLHYLAGILLFRRAIANQKQYHTALNLRNSGLPSSGCFPRGDGGEQTALLFVSGEPERPRETSRSLKPERDLGGIVGREKFRSIGTSPSGPKLSRPTESTPRFSHLSLPLALPPRTRHPPTPNLTLRQEQRHAFRLERLPGRTRQIHSRFRQALPRLAPGVPDPDCHQFQDLAPGRENAPTYLPRRRRNHPVRRLDHFPPGRRSENWRVESGNCRSRRSRHGDERQRRLGDSLRALASFDAHPPRP